MATGRCAACWSSRVCLWLVANHLLLRPLFYFLNCHAFREWQCPPRLAVEAGLASGDTGLEVVVASAGNAGSTTLHMVLEELGFRTYGPEEFAFYAPGLRYEALGEVDWTHEAGLPKACGVRAVVADLLTMPLVKAVMPRSPHAKLIVLRRPWGKWVPSKRSTLLRGPRSNLAMGALTLAGLCNWLPWGLLWPAAPGDRGSSFARDSGSLTMELLNHCNFLVRGAESIAANPRRAPDLQRQLSRLMEDEGAYNETLDSYSRLAPPSRVWETQIDDITFESLADFLALPPPPVRGKLPRTKSGGLGKLLIRMQLHPVRHAAALSFLALTALVNWLLFGMLLDFARRRWLWHQHGKGD